MKSEKRQTREFRRIQHHAQLLGEFQNTLDSSPYARAAAAAGFSFGRVMIRRASSFEDSMRRLYVMVPFTCVCGREEFGWLAICHNYDNDIARALFNNGSFSEAHLIEDGYSKNDARAIAEKFSAEFHRLTL